MKTYYFISCSQYPIVGLDAIDLHDTIEEAQVELKDFQDLQKRWKIFKVTVEECPS